MRNICHAVAFTASAVPNKNFKIKQRIVLIRFCFQAIVYFVFLSLSLSLGNLLKFANGKTHCTELTECVFETFALNTRFLALRLCSDIVLLLCTNHLHFIQIAFYKWIQHDKTCAKVSFSLLLLVRDVHHKNCVYIVFRLSITDFGRHKSVRARGLIARAFVFH